MGDYRSVICRPFDAAAVYSMGYEDRPERARWGPGRRNYCIVHYVTSGKGRFNGHEVCAEQGFYIRAGQMHEYHADAKEGWNYFWMILTEELAKQYVLPYIDVNENGIFRAEFAGRLPVERQRIFAEKRPMQHLEALSIFFSVMAMHEKGRRNEASAALAHLNGAKTLIENSFGRRMTVREVAREIAIDDRYLYNLFIRYEGVPPKEYIDRCTVNNACALLRGSGMSVTEIAGRLGFDDVCTFSRFFSRRTGVSPTQYRMK